MLNDALIKELNALPQDMIRQVEEYVRFLRFSKQETENAQTLRKRQGGILSGGLLYMAEDFDETPDCFQEYM